MPKQQLNYRTLRAWRRKQGLNQGQAAAYLSVSQPYYSRVERYLAAPRPAMAKALSLKTGVSVESILGIA